MYSCRDASSRRRPRLTKIMTSSVLVTSPSQVSQYELPDSTLDKIIELSDQDKDGLLDRYEWTVAKHQAW